MPRLSTQQFYVYGEEDTAYPNVTITQPTGTFSSSSITLNFNVTDDVALDICFYNITDDTVTRVEVARTTFTCGNFTSSASISTNDDYITTVVANDTSGNANTTIGTFSVNIASQSSGTSSSGGGGAPTPSSKKCAEGEALISNECINASAFNVSLKIFGIANPSPIFLYGECWGGKGDYSHTFRLNKVVRNASFEMDSGFEVVNISKSTVIVKKDLKLFNNLASRVESSKLRIVDTTNQVVFSQLSLTVFNTCFFIPAEINTEIKAKNNPLRFFLAVGSDSKIKGIYAHWIILSTLLIVVIFRRPIIGYFKTLRKK
mgnify:FL=1